MVNFQFAVYLYPLNTKFLVPLLRGYSVERYVTFLDGCTAMDFIFQYINVVFEFKIY